MPLIALGRSTGNNEASCSAYHTLCLLYYYSANVKRLVGENEALQDNISKVSYLYA